VAHQTSAAIIGYLVGMSLEQSRYLGFDRLCEKRSRTITQHLGQRIGKSSWLRRHSTIHRLDYDSRPC
jgi:hypothetical protein